MCGFLVSSVELLVTSERKAVGRDHQNIWVWGDCDLQGRPMRKWNQRLKLLEVVKPLFNISSDKHVSGSQMPVVRGTTKTEVHSFYSCPPGDYSIRKKQKKTNKKKQPTQVFIEVLFFPEWKFGKEGEKFFFQNSSNSTNLFKKIRNTKGIFYAKMGTIKARNGMDLTEEEYIKMRWQEYTEL